MIPKALNEIDVELVEFNRARICEEVSQGIFDLMNRQGVIRKRLGDLLGKDKSRISLMLNQEQNFQLQTLADIFLVLGRAVHITLGTDIEELRIPLDEIELEQSGATDGKKEAQTITKDEYINFYEESFTQEGAPIWDSDRSADSLGGQYASLAYAGT